MLNSKEGINAMSDEKKKMASCARKYAITESDLPLSCPMDDMTLWNAHPKVFLPLDKQGKATCYYCGATYELKQKS